MFFDLLSQEAFFWSKGRFLAMVWKVGLYSEIFSMPEKGKKNLSNWFLVSDSSHFIYILIILFINSSHFDWSHFIYWQSYVIYSVSHVIYWLESCYLLTESCYLLTESCYLLTRVILFLDWSHVIYWLESFSLLTRGILFIE